MSRPPYRGPVPQLLLEGGPMRATPICSSARLSSDRLYRYSLKRDWTPEGALPRRVLFVMLNPSTADESADDPTIRRCVSFAEREGGTCLEVVNLFAFRATDPAALRGASDPIGPENDGAINAAAARADLVIAAWGSRENFQRFAPDRPVRLLQLLGGKQLQCLGRTAAGDPRHPLYLPGNAPLEVWREPPPPGPPRRVFAPIVPESARAERDTTSTVLPVSSRICATTSTTSDVPSREPISQAWHEVARECPAHRSAAEHCWPAVDGLGWAHVVVGLSTAPESFRCVPARRHPDHAAGVLLPIDGLAIGERISAAQSFAELGGRY